MTEVGRGPHTRRDQFPAADGGLVTKPSPFSFAAMVGPVANLRRKARQASFLLFAALSALALAPVAFGQTIPANKLEKNNATGACTVVLIPDMRTSDTSPMLVVTGGGKGKANSLGIDVVTEGVAVAVEFVARNKRTPFQGVAPKDAAAVIRTALWTDLVLIQKSKAPFHISARLDDGTWTSSRYENLDPLGIIRLLEQNCDFSSDTITARSPADLAKEEQALNLRPDDVRHIRWVLTQRFNPLANEPAEAASFTSNDRLYIERYAKSVGQPPTKYLNRTLANMLLSEPFQPVAFDYSRMRNVTYLGDWVNYTDPTDGRCYMATSAYSWSSGRFFRAPRMVFSADTSSPNDLMYFSMVEPNPFMGTERLVAIVDGRDYRLQIERETWVKPAAEGTGVSDAVMRAMSRGSLVQISGVQIGTRTPLALSFSALGFTASFRRMMDDCRRPGLREWLR